MLILADLQSIPSSSSSSSPSPSLSSLSTSTARRRSSSSSSKASICHVHPQLLSIIVLITVTIFSILCQSASSKMLSAPIQVHHPQPLRPGSTKGFHRTIIMHDPYTTTTAPSASSFPGRVIRRFIPILRSKQSKSAKPATETYHNVDLYGGMVAVGEYYARVKIGGQTLRVQIDTGSATLAAPLKQCTNCKRGDMRYSLEDSDSGQAHYIACDHAECERGTCSYGCDTCSSTKACCSKANSSSCAFHLNFGDGSGAKGMLVNDVFEWGDVKFPVTFGGIASDSPDFERKQVDGILGMAYKSLACNPSCITPTLDAMLDEHRKNGMKDIFAICITYNSGRLVLGDYDPGLSSTKDISWVPLQLSSPPSFYSFPVRGDLLVDGKALVLPHYSTAIVDSGTTLIVFSSATFNTFKSHLLSNYCDVPGLCPGQNGGDESWFQAAHCTKIQDKDRMKLPVLTFKLDGFDLEMGPSDYLINYASKGSEFWCVGIMSLDSMSGGVNVILGNTVMKKYVTVYDRDNSRVGFAISDTNCGGSGNKTKAGDGGGSGSDSNVAGLNAGSGDDDDDDDDDKGSTDVNNDAICRKATNCSQCVNVENVSCKWDVPHQKCIGGSALSWMCKLEELESNFKVWIGGAVAAVVITIVVVAIVVQLIRKRQEREMMDDGSENDVRQPLEPHDQQGSLDPVDTRGAFAIDDDEEDSRI